MNTPLQVHELPLVASLQDAINTAAGLAPNANVAGLNRARLGNQGAYPASAQARVSH